MLPPPPTCPLSLSSIHPTQQLLLSRGELEKSFRDMKPQRRLMKLSVLCPDDLENRTVPFAVKVPWRSKCGVSMLLWKQLKRMMAQAEPSKVELGQKPAILGASLGEEGCYLTLL